MQLLLLSTSTASAQQSQARTISVEGNGSVVVTPDEALFTLGIKTAHAELAKAKHQNDGQARRLLTKLKELGLTEHQIQTAAVSVSIQYDRDEDAKVTAYVVRRAYAIRLNDPKKLEPVIEAALTNGANETSDVKYHSTQLAKHRAEARKIALRDAVQKAEAMARELGCKVGRPITIADNSPTRGFGFLGGFAGDAEEGDVKTMLGQIEVSAEVSVSFELMVP